MQFTGFTTEPMTPVRIPSSLPLDRRMQATTAPHKPHHSLLSLAHRCSRLSRDSTATKMKSYRLTAYRSTFKVARAKDALHAMQATSGPSLYTVHVSATRLGERTVACVCRTEKDNCAFPGYGTGAYVSILFVISHSASFVHDNPKQHCPPLNQ